jgi:hypothetical protein
MKCPSFGSFSEHSDEQIISSIVQKVEERKTLNLAMIVMSVGQPLNNHFLNQLKAYTLAFGDSFWNSCAFVITNYHVSGFS